MRAAIALHDSQLRAHQAELLLEGPHLLEEAVAAGVRVLRVFALEEDTAAAALAKRVGAELVLIQTHLLFRVSTVNSPQSPVAIATRPVRPPTAPAALVAWEINDPANLGSLARIAAGFGMDLLTQAGADPWGPKALRAGAGGQFRIGLEGIGSDGLEGLIERGYQLVAAVPVGGDLPWQAKFGDRPAFVAGSEAHGLPEAVIRVAATRVSIPMPGGTESLNVAAAAAILGYEWLRSKRLPSP